MSPSDPSLTAPTTQTHQLPPPGLASLSPRKGDSLGQGGGSQLLGGGGREAASSLRQRVSAYLQDLVHDFLHDLTLGLCITAVQKGEEISGMSVIAEGRTHTHRAARSHAQGQNKGALCDSAVWGG